VIVTGSEGGTWAMPYVLWSEMFEIGVPDIDAQHRQLLDIINHFHGALKSGESPNHVFATLNALIRYTQAHFAGEEAIMEQSSYPAEKVEQHKKIHEQLVTDIFNLQEQLAGNSKSIVHDIETFLNGWLIQHILLVDKRLGAYCVPGRGAPAA